MKNINLQVMFEALDDIRKVVSLRNIDNTCFMNSLLQCMFKTKDLVNVINSHPSSPLPSNLAECFSALFKNVNSLKNDKIIENELIRFKASLVKVNSTFTGKHEQDDQEVLTTLRDELHECYWTNDLVATKLIST